MKKNVLKVFVASVVGTALLAGGMSFTPTKAATQSKQYRNVGYVFQRGSDISKLDVTKITHLNYSFGLIYNDEYDNDTVDQDGNPIKVGTPSNPDVQTPEPVPEGKKNTIYLPEKVESDLTRIAAGELKAKNPKLKVLLSVGGFDARGFSDAAATDEARKTFAKSCKETIDTYKLDGIDLDWEYPINGGWGSIEANPNDKQNFTSLLQEVRNAIGKDKLLTIAGSANTMFTGKSDDGNNGLGGTWTEFDKVIPILDYINIMTYDFQYDSNYFGSALYKSKEWAPKDDVEGYWCDKAVKNYIANGCPAEKINLGLAFAAPLPEVVQRNKTVYNEIKERLKAAGWNDSKEPTLKKVKDLLEDKNGFTKEWDADAQVMYIATEINGKKEFVRSYIEPQGLTAKINYVKEMGLGGTMFWEFGSDYDNLLVTQITEEFNNYEPITETPSTPEDKKEETDKKENSAVKTGDTAPIVALLGLGGLAVLGMGAIILKKRA